MDIFIKSFMPNILNALILIAFSLLFAFCVGLYATKKWGGSNLTSLFVIGNSYDSFVLKIL